MIVGSPLEGGQLNGQLTYANIWYEHTCTHARGTLDLPIGDTTQKILTDGATQSCLPTDILIVYHTGMQ